MLKRLLLICMCAALLQMPSAFAAGGLEVIDYCDDFSKVYEKSDSWEIEDTKADSFAGDAGVFMRTSSTDVQYLTYELPRVESAEILYYYYTLDAYLSALTIKGSSDNASWQEISTAASTVNGLSGAWKGVYINTTSIPEGVKYIRIEIDSTASMAAWCGIGKVTLVQGESDYVNTPIPEPGEYSVTEDSCMSFDMLYDKSDNWRVETSEDQWGDAGRIIKSADTGTEYIVYKVPSAVKMDVGINYTGGMTDPFEFVTVEASPDGANYTEAEIPGGAPAGLTGGNWSTYTASVELPEGTEYVKISIAQTNYGAPWWLIFTNFKFYSSFPYEIKTGGIDVSGGIAAADYTVTVNYKVYDSITMYLAAYDENGMLLDICADTAAADVGDVELSTSLNISDKTKHVRAFFLNSLQGMHRICDTVKAQ